jgi:cell division protein FtsL
MNIIFIVHVKNKIANTNQDIPKLWSKIILQFRNINELIVIQEIIMIVFIIIRLKIIYII